MKRAAIIVSLCLIAGSIALASTSDAAADRVLTFTGLDPVGFGMTVSEAETALGTKLKPLYQVEDPGCWFAGRADGVDATIAYLIQEGQITRIDIESYKIGQMGSEKNRPFPPSVAFTLGRPSKM